MKDLVGPRADGEHSNLHTPTDACGSRKWHQNILRERIHCKVRGRTKRNEALTLSAPFTKEKYRVALTLSPPRTRSTRPRRQYQGRGQKTRALNREARSPPAAVRGRGSGRGGRRPPRLSLRRRWIGRHLRRHLPRSCRFPLSMPSVRRPRGGGEDGAVAPARREPSGVLDLESIEDRG